MNPWLAPVLIFAGLVAGGAIVLYMPSMGIPWLPTPSPTPNVIQTVTAAVNATAQAERATTADERQAWVKAGREFFAIEPLALDAEQVFFVSGLVNTSELSEGDLARASDEQNRVEDAINLLPVPQTNEGSAVKTQFQEAVAALGRIRKDAGDKSKHGLQGMTPSDVAFNNSWAAARQRLLRNLSVNAIALSDVAPKPQATATSAAAPAAIVQVGTPQFDGTCGPQRPASGPGFYGCAVSVTVRNAGEAKGNTMVEFVISDSPNPPPRGSTLGHCSEPTPILTAGQVAKVSCTVPIDVSAPPRVYVFASVD